MEYEQICNNIPASLRLFLDEQIARLDEDVRDRIKKFIEHMVNGQELVNPSDITAELYVIADWLESLESPANVSQQLRDDAILGDFHPLSETVLAYQAYQEKNPSMTFSRLLHRALPHIEPLFSSLTEHDALSPEDIERFKVEVLVEYRDAVRGPPPSTPTRKEISNLIIGKLIKRTDTDDPNYDANWDSAVQAVQAEQDDHYPQSSIDFLRRYIRAVTYDTPQPCELTRTPVFFAHINPEALSSDIEAIRRAFPYHGFIIIGERDDNGVVLRRLATDIMLAPLTLMPSLSKRQESQLTPSFLLSLSKQYVLLTTVGITLSNIL